MLRVGGFAVALAFTMIGASASTAFATFPGANGRIAYESYGGHGATLHTVLPNGHADMRIAPRGGDTDWAPDGRRLAFTSYNERGQDDIYTMRADGADVRRLTTDGEDPYYGGAWNPSYSPGGHRLVFEYTHYHAPNYIATMRDDGSGRHAITDDDRIGGSVGGAVWSPGREIAYIRYGVADERASLWATRPDGSHQHRLVNLGVGGYAGGYGPIYSPDGSKFMFVRYRRDGSVHSFVANAGGTHIRASPCTVLSTASEEPQPLGVFPIAYSPNGKWVLAGNQYDTGHGYAANLLRLSLGSCKIQRVVGRASLFGAAWQRLPSG